MLVWFNIVVAILFAGLEIAALVATSRTPCKFHGPNTTQRSVSLGGISFSGVQYLRWKPWMASLRQCRRGPAGQMAMYCALPRDIPAMCTADHRYVSMIVERCTVSKSVQACMNRHRELKHSRLLTDCHNFVAAGQVTRVFPVQLPTLLAK